MPRSKPLPEWLTQDELRRMFHYDPVSGIFTYLIDIPHNPRRCGDIAGGSSGLHGHIMIDHRGYLQHRLAWFYMTGEWPQEEIDHIDGNGHNNAWSNLRKATRQQNRANSRKSTRNTSGLKGVYFNKRMKKWHTQIKINGKKRHLGVFVNKQKAHEAYVVAHRELFGDFTPDEKRMNS